jgi:hypothetical protein
MPQKKWISLSNARALTTATDACAILDAGPSRHMQYPLLPFPLNPVYSRLSTIREKPSRLEYKCSTLDFEDKSLGYSIKQERNSLLFGGFETCLVAENVEVLPIVMKGIGRRHPR